ncbi:LCP2 [Symbiodinium sp. CCMP2592]|nr:LCP2 [Symbiodinium sp. CCMP2592]
MAKKGLIDQWLPGSEPTRSEVLRAFESFETGAQTMVQVVLLAFRYEALASLRFDNTLFRETFGYSHLYTTEADPLRVAGHMSSTESVAMVAAAQKQSRPRQTHSHNKRPGTLTLVAGPVVISLCTMVLVMLCGGLSLSVACSTSWSLCSLCQFGFFVSSPATHVCGFVTQPAYRLWMPFQGGSLHVFLQGIGWSCFALLLMQWCASYYGEEMLLTEFPYVGDSRLKAAFGLIAQVTLGLSVLAFKTPWEKTKRS